MLLKQHEPDVVLLNRGIWYQNNTLLLPALNQTLSTMEDWMAQRTATNGSKTTFIWRTTAPGMPRCYNETAPLNDLQAQIERVTASSNPWYQSIPKRSMYNWWEIPKQNQLVQQLLDQSSIDFQYIDAFEMYLQRPDLRQSQHASNEKDCLHQCLPGPPDEVNRVLQHILQQREHRLSKHA